MVATAINVCDRVSKSELNICAVAVSRSRAICAKVIVVIGGKRTPVCGFGVGQNLHEKFPVCCVCEESVSSDANA